LRSTRRDRPGSGTHHTVPCYGCAALPARDDHVGHLARTRRQRLRGRSAGRPLEAPAARSASLPHAVHDRRRSSGPGPRKRCGTEGWNPESASIPHSALLVRPSPAIRLLARRAGAERSTQSFRWSSGTRCRMDGADAATPPSGWSVLGMPRRRPRSRRAVAGQVLTNGSSDRPPSRHAGERDVPDNMRESRGGRGQGPLSGRDH